MMGYNISQLESLCPSGFERNTSLAAISKWRIGGDADILLRPQSVEELAKLRSWFHQNSIPHLIIGSTSNLLFDDEGLRVPCIQIGERMSGIHIAADKVYAQAGAWVPKFSRRLMNSGLTGGEHVCGIPGTIGGLVYMNGGSQRRSIGSNIVSVESVDSKGDIITREVDECEFSYRNSVYQRTEEVITSALFDFNIGERHSIRKNMLSILAERKRKFPRGQPNCGSVFKSDPDMYADIGPPGKVIELFGLKGKRVGKACVSSQHANFIVNEGGAKSADVLNLIKEISNCVVRESGYRLESEVLYVDPVGKLMPASSFFI
ncbi:UDP-N-acetylmuramate dehydrogenase [Halomonas sp. CS7]|uniref:UDP-N-acetylenolpyruvoylglucosamine reductase n=1 Tax=Halomonas pelophila TaxID=3151122 RepID=A0ABV1N3E5_9GAMM